MTSFEKYLQQIGYIKHAFDSSKMQYYIPTRHIISTMSNLAHVYIHSTDKVLLDKIEKEKKVTLEKESDLITFADRSKEIVFGLHEHGKPPTLITPRPNIKVKRKEIIDGVEQIVTYTQWFDDSMNVALSKQTPEEIYKAMYDENIIFEYDFT